MGWGRRVTDGPRHAAEGFRAATDLTASGLTAISLGVPGRLHAVTLSLPAGRLCAVLGPNGAGKSTLLDVLSGRRQPATGRVLLGEELLATIDAIRLARRRSVLRQYEPLVPGLVVRDFVTLGRLPWRGLVDAATDRRRVDMALAETRLEGYAARAVETLSGGERQRARLARALAQLPETAPGLLMLDEPAAHLDPARQSEALALARKVADRGLAVLAVLHEPLLAAAFADDVVLLAEGRVVAAGPAAEMLTAARLTALYGVPFTLVETPRGPWPVAIPRAFQSL